MYDARHCRRAHVAPILDEKLKCIAEITNRNFDIIDLLQRDNPMLATRVKIRSEEQASIDADNDDTIVADFVSKGNEDEEDDDEITSEEDLIK